MNAHETYVPYPLMITTVLPWNTLNAYEGEVHGTVGMYPVCCYVQLPSQSHWRTHAAGNTITIDLWLERTGPCKVRRHAQVQPQLKQLGGTQYEVSGTVRRLAGDQIELDTVFPLRIDLDRTLHMPTPLPTILVGDQVRVIGQLKADLEPPQKEQLPHLDQTLLDAAFAQAKKFSTVRFSNAWAALLRLFPDAALANVALAYANACDLADACYDVGEQCRSAAMTRAQAEQLLSDHFPGFSPAMYEDAVSYGLFITR